MPNILCISFPVEPSEIDLAKTLVGCTSDNKDMYIYLIGSMKILMSGRWKMM